MNTGRDWIILCCKGANTLRLAQSLAWAGIEAWSPAETLTEREGEQRSRRFKRIPIMARYVFARAEHEHELLAIREAPTNPHPAFWFLRHLGEIRPIPDAILDPLRVAEQKGRPITQARQWKKGDRVRYPAAGFEGLVGTVERRRGQSVWVDFPGMPWLAETSAFLLLEDGAEHHARAA